MPAPEKLLGMTWAIVSAEGQARESLESKAYEEALGYELSKTLHNIWPGEHPTTQFTFEEVYSSLWQLKIERNGTTQRVRRSGNPEGIACGYSTVLSEIPMPSANVVKEITFFEGVGLDNRQAPTVIMNIRYDDVTLPLVNILCSGSELGNMHIREIVLCPMGADQREFLGQKLAIRDVFTYQFKPPAAARARQAVSATAGAST